MNIQAKDIKGNRVNEHMVWFCLLSLRYPLMEKLSSSLEDVCFFLVGRVGRLLHRPVRKNDKEIGKMSS